MHGVGTIGAGGSVVGSVRIRRTGASGSLSYIFAFSGSESVDRLPSPNVPVVTNIYLSSRGPALVDLLVSLRYLVACTVAFK